MDLASDDIHFWYCDPEAITDTETISYYLSLLTSEETEKYHRYIFDRHRHQYLVTRALVKTTLSFYESGIKPGEWRFEKNQWGRPNIIDSQNPGHLQFNLTHTDGLIGCAVSLEKELGVDVEDVNREGETTKIAHRFFSPAEVAELKSLPEEKQRDRFFDYWTLKESYIKARGMGLAIPLRHFSFSFTEDNLVNISFAPELEDDSEGWNFCTLIAAQRFKISTGIKHCTSPRMNCYSVIPSQEPGKTTLETLYPFKNAIGQ